MARTKNKSSKIPFDGLGLEPAEETELKRLLKVKDISMNQLKRALVRTWMEEQGVKLKSV